MILAIYLELAGIEGLVLVLPLQRLLSSSLIKWSAETQTASAAAVRNSANRSRAAETLAIFAFSTAAPVRLLLGDAIASVNTEDYMNTVRNSDKNMSNARAESYGGTRRKFFYSFLSHPLLLFQPRV